MIRASAYFALLIALFCSTSAAADTYSVYPDDGPSVISSPQSGDVIAVSVSGKHSFCCTFKTKESLAIGQERPFVATGGFSSARNAAGSEITFSFDEGTRLPVISETEGENVTSRACMRSQNEGANGGDIVYLTLDMSGTSPAEARVACEDTTLIGGFNTYASDFIFLELIATQERRGHIVTVQGLDTEDNELFSISLEVVARKDVAIHPLVAKSSIGRLVVTHDGPAASLKGYVAEYRQDSSSVGGLILVDRQELSR